MITFHAEQVPLQRWQAVWENYSRWLTIKGKVSEISTQVEQIFWYRDSSPDKLNLFVLFI